MFYFSHKELVSKVTIKETDKNVEVYDFWISVFGLLFCLRLYTL